MLSWLGQVGSAYVERGEENIKHQEPYYRTRNISLSDAPPCGETAISILREVMLGVWGPDNNTSCTIQPDVVVGMLVIESHPLEGDTDKVRVNRVEGFLHVPGADAAPTSTLLDFFLQINQI